MGFAMEAAMHHFPLRLPRHGVSPRQVARAGDVWRLFQEAAVLASAEVGWTGERFITERVGFIVSRMTVLHHRELAYGEAVDASTWLRDWRRDTISRREVRLDVAGRRFAEATQQWVHVALGDDDDSITPERASIDLLDAFPAVSVDEPMVKLPDIVTPVQASAHVWAFEVWHTWMDPFAHVNHPVYVDWCDESTSRCLVAAGLDPQDMVPVAEQVRFKRGLVGGTRGHVATQLVGTTEAGDAVLRHRIEIASGEVAADAITVRRMRSESQLDWLTVFR